MIPVRPLANSLSRCCRYASLRVSHFHTNRLAHRLIYQAEVTIPRGFQKEGSHRFTHASRFFPPITAALATLMSQTECEGREERTWSEKHRKAAKILNIATYKIDAQRLIHSHHSKIPYYPYSSTEEFEEECIRQVLTWAIDSAKGQLEHKEEQKLLEGMKAIAGFKDSLGRTLLMRAIDEGHGQTALKLLQTEDSSLLYDAEGLLRDDKGWTPLHYTVMSEESDSITSELIRLLCAQGVGIDVASALGTTPLAMAIYTENNRLVELLIQQNASLTKTSSFTIRKGLRVPLSPLMGAIWAGHSTCVKTLIKELQERVKKKILGKNTLKKQFQIPGMGNVVHLCIQAQNLEQLNLLRNNYWDLIKPMINEEDSEGRTPLALAAKEGDIQSMETVIKLGADIEHPNDEDMHPMHYAALSCNPGAVALLAKHGASLYPIDSEGNTPYALLNGVKTPEARQTQAKIRSLNKANAIQQKMAPIDFAYHPPENLVFAGGGPKGIAFVGALKQLEKEKKLDDLIRVGGTSAGAITAMLVALGCRSDDLEYTLRKTDLTSFLDTPWKNWTSWLSFDSSDSSYKEKFQTALKIYRTLSSPTKTAETLISSLWRSEGVCDGEFFLKWAEEQVANQTMKALGEAQPHLTFGELKRYIDSGKPFKHLYVYAVRIYPSGKHELVCMNSENPGGYADVPIADGVRASMSIPGVFKPATLRCKNAMGDLNTSPSHGQFFDGGLVNNFPLNAFDEQKFVKRGGHLGESADLGVTNTRTLGLYLSSRDKETKPSEKVVNDVGDIAKQTLLAFYNAQDILLEAKPADFKRIIEIDTGAVTLLSFGIDQKQQDALIKSGESATNVFLNRGERKGNV